ncbi:hypothetical protein NQ318_017208 [Aromia moschata]|uniref:Uncharacterized protein n=1 Tax=Aromia moschata TaxID=1265417 RepID=A0AAV8YN21_9CUCU|nr:hypothetical protein NQ318_017208 [Aromia moschata]
MIGYGDRTRTQAEVVHLFQEKYPEMPPISQGTFLKSQPEDLTLGDGVHLINTRSENDARSNMDDGSFLGTLENYLESHELRIRLPELMPGEDFGRAFNTAMNEVEGKDESSPRGGGGGGGGGGKKGGGGGAGIMLMGLMMGKMLAALGIGGVGLLAMKALMVSALALMLSIIIGLKKLVHSDHDDSGHTVIHASPGHGGHEYRKKREAGDIAYHAWEEYKLS